MKKEIVVVIPGIGGHTQGETVKEFSKSLSVYGFEPYQELKPDQVLYLPTEDAEKQAKSCKEDKQLDNSNKTEQSTKLNDERNIETFAVPQQEMNFKDKTFLLNELHWNDISNVQHTRLSIFGNLVRLILDARLLLDPIHNSMGKEGDRLNFLSKWNKINYGFLLGPILAYSILLLLMILTYIVGDQFLFFRNLTKLIYPESYSSWHIGQCIPLAIGGVFGLFSLYLFFKPHKNKSYFLKLFSLAFPCIFVVGVCGEALIYWWGHLITIGDWQIHILGYGIIDGESLKYRLFEENQTYTIASVHLLLHVFLFHCCWILFISSLSFNYVVSGWRSLRSKNKHITRAIASSVGIVSLSVAFWLLVFPTVFILVDGLFRPSEPAISSYTITDKQIKEYREIACGVLSKQEDRKACTDAITDESLPKEYTEEIILKAKERCDAASASVTDFNYRDSCYAAITAMKSLRDYSHIKENAFRVDTVTTKDNTIEYTYYEIDNHFIIDKSILIRGIPVLGWVWLGFFGFCLMVLPYWFYRENWFKKEEEQGESTEEKKEEEQQYSRLIPLVVGLFLMPICVYLCIACTSSPAELVIQNPWLSFGFLCLIVGLFWAVAWLKPGEKVNRRRYQALAISIGGIIVSFFIGFSSYVQNCPCEDEKTVAWVVNFTFVILIGSYWFTFLLLNRTLSKMNNGAPRLVLSSSLHRVVLMTIPSLAALTVILVFVRGDCFMCTSDAAGYSMLILMGVVILPLILSLFDNLRVGLDIALDIINYFTPTNNSDKIFPLRDQLHYRLNTILNHQYNKVTKDSTEDTTQKNVDLLIVAHSQGTMIALDYIENYLYADDTNKSSYSISKFENIKLVTMGSPFTDLYQYYFNYHPKQGIDSRKEGWKIFDKSNGTDTDDEFKFDWINIYRIDDYVGTKIVNPEEETAQAQNSNANKSQTGKKKIEFPKNEQVSKRGHLLYFSDNQVIPKIVKFIQKKKTIKG